MSKSTEIAETVLYQAKALDLRVRVERDVLYVTGTFDANSTEQYRSVVSDIYRVLRVVPVTGASSTWGDDGVATSIAIETGHLTVKRSGCSKRVLTALKQTMGSLTSSGIDLY